MTRHEGPDAAGGPDPVRAVPGHPAAFHGAGAADRLPGVLAGLGARTVLVVHGGQSYVDSGAAGVLAAVGGHAESRPVGPNPDLGVVAEAVATGRRLRPDAVVGIGGGSVLDVAKAVAVLAAQDHGVRECLRSPALVRRPRTAALVLVPTTAGSGSELTRFATVWLGPGGSGAEKVSLEHEQVRADVALVDPDLLRTVPRPVSVATGLDAFCQAVESYWAVAGTAASRSLARAALDALTPALHRATVSGSFAAADQRSALGWGAALAGAAIDRTRTTAAHALSYLLTARVGLPHGVAVALHLRWLLAHHETGPAAECRHPAGPAGLRALVADVRAVVADGTGGTVEGLLDRLLALGGFPPALADLGLTDALTDPLTDPPAGPLAEPLAGLPPAGPSRAGPPLAEALGAALRTGRAANNPRLVSVADVTARLDPQGGHR